MTESHATAGKGTADMIDLELATEGRIARLRDAAATLRYERSASVVDGRLRLRTRLRLRLGRQLVVLGTILLAGSPRRVRT
jgi:hypothetical protein